MPATNYDEVVAVTDDIAWVGFYDIETNLYCNPYLLIDEPDVVLIDPGSMRYFPKIMRKVIDVVDPARITTMIVSQQDPDVCGNLAVMEEVVDNPDTQIIAHTNTIGLLRHSGLKSRFFPVDEHDYTYKLRSGRRLNFIFTPYLHSPGAIMTYDVKTRSLFTSDVFGAISGNWSLFADGNFLEAMKVWHQIYIPCNALLKACMQRLETMHIDRVIPLHGSIFEAGNIPAAISYLKQLPCGLDLINQGL